MDRSQRDLQGEEKISKNIDFSLWGKQCIVLPNYIFFWLLAHRASPSIFPIKMFQAFRRSFGWPIKSSFLIQKYGWSTCDFHDSLTSLHDNRESWSKCQKIFWLIWTNPGLFVNFSIEVFFFQKKMLKCYLFVVSNCTRVKMKTKHMVCICNQLQINHFLRWLLITYFIGIF